jgi:hypothetical protein
MTIRKFKPPKCPGCKKPLFAVYENEYWTYDFNEDTGTYKAYLADMEIRCPDCHYHITREPFPEGACNYQAKVSDTTE